MRSLKNETVLITGASSGIGEAFAWQFARLGCDLILTARSGNKLKQVAGEIERTYLTDITVIPADLSRPGAPDELVEAIHAKGISVDILVNNAGFGKWANFLREELQTYMEMMQVNMNALVRLTYLLLPGMIKKEKGGIINIGSTGSFQPCPYVAVYCASKSFVLNFSEALYGEYHKKGVTITAVCPGNTRTGFFATANAKTEGFSFASPERVAKEGIAAFLKRRNYVVTGGFGNYLQSVSSRFLPRRTIIGIVGKMFRNRVRGGQP